MLIQLVEIELFSSRILATQILRGVKALEAENCTIMCFERVRYPARCTWYSKDRGKGYPLWPKGRGLDSHLPQRGGQCPCSLKRLKSPRGRVNMCYECLLTYLFRFLFVHCTHWKFACCEIVALLLCGGVTDS